MAAVLGVLLVLTLRRSSSLRVMLVVGLRVLLVRLGVLLVGLRRLMGLGVLLMLVRGVKRRVEGC